MQARQREGLCDHNRSGMNGRHESDNVDAEPSGPATVSINAKKGQPANLLIQINEDEDGSTSISSVFTLCNSAIGAGVLSLPYAFRKSGEISLIRHPPGVCSMSQPGTPSNGTSMLLMLPAGKCLCHENCTDARRPHWLLPPVHHFGRLRSFHDVCVVQIR